MAPRTTFERLGQEARVFSRNLYAEHLDEASFLYRRWWNDYEDTSVSWDELANVAARLDRHLDALRVSNELIVDLCNERATSADREDGAVYAAAHLYCRWRDYSKLAHLASTLSSGDDLCTRAFEDALVQEAPATWAYSLGGLVGAAADTYGERDATLPGQWVQPNATLAQALISAIGHRRLAVGSEVQRAVHGGIVDPVVCLWALGRLKDSTSGALLLRYAGASDARVRQAAILSAVHLGLLQAVELLQHVPPSESWPAIPLAVWGQREALDVLWGMARHCADSRDLLMALGIFGLPESVDLLLRGLTGPSAEAAAAGLYLLTGAEVSEDVHAYGPTVVGLRLDDDQSADIKTRRLSRDIDDWRIWWSVNGKRFERGIRYRFGRPYEAADSEGAILSRLRWLPRDIRQVVADDRPSPAFVAGPYRKRHG